jgi:chemotaxis signal transduction protein
LLSERLNAPAGLLVGAVSGLRNVDTLERVPPGAQVAPWIVATWRDAEGSLWEEVDLAQVVASAAFLHVEAA